MGIRTYGEVNIFSHILYIYITDDGKILQDDKLDASIPPEDSPDGFIFRGVLVQQNIFMANVILYIFPIYTKKSRIRETKHLSTDADSSTDAIGGWTKAK